MNEVYRNLDKKSIYTQKNSNVLYFCRIIYTIERMDIEQIIRNAGSQSELARLLGVSRGAVWIWKRDGLPKSRIWQLQLLKPDWFTKENHELRTH